MAAIAAAAMAVNSGYADLSAAAKTADSQTVKTETAEEKAPAFEGERKIETNFGVCKAMLVSDDRIYCMGANRNSGRGVTIFSADYEGNILNSLEIKSGMSDEGGELNAYGETMKQVGDHLYYFYKVTPHVDLNLPEDGSWVEVSPSLIPRLNATKSFKCLKLDKELNIIDEYELKDFVKHEQDIDINSTKICYVKSSSRIYLANPDGSDEKLIYKVGSDESGIRYINSVAMNDDYIAFAAQKPSGTSTTVKNSDGTVYYMSDPDFQYCGIIDLKTGEVKVEEKKGASFPEADDNGIIWDNASSEKPWNDNGPGAVYSFDGENFTTSKTKTVYESSQNHIDSDGRTAAYNPRTDTLRVYENGKCVKEIDVNGDDMVGFVGFTANNGVAAIGYTDTKSGTTCKVKLIAY